MKPKRFPVLIFDFDGTLADSWGLCIRLLQEHSESLKLPKLDSTHLLQLKQLPLKQLFKEWGIKSYQLPKLMYQFRQLMRDNASHIQPISGVKPLLEALKGAGFSYGVVSSNSRHLIEDFFTRWRLPAMDFCSAGASLFGKHQMLKKVLKYMQLNCKQVVYVGDEVRDILASKKLHIPVIAVAWGFNEQAILTAYQPDALVTTPVDIWYQIERLNKLS